MYATVGTDLGSRRDIAHKGYIGHGRTRYELDALHHTLAVDSWPVRVNVQLEDAHAPIVHLIKSESSGSHGGYAEPNLATAVGRYERSFGPPIEGEMILWKRCRSTWAITWAQPFLSSAVSVLLFKETQYSRPDRMSGILRSPYVPPDGRELIMSVNTGWRHCQTMKRLTHGNFFAEYRVPTAKYNAMEAQYTAAR